ncbi:RHS repeat-associated core domain-containing protein [Caulobacter sp. RL271]|uniref:PAAR domain-containing protein n=1 Tax=Caulobacter segnis TaxID=88688 RepID=A0ABY4ZV19_9CAUL|nr:RHS repeat-associated core domain-containing protein [Caulobacter segnis]USQ96570.1 PAAR domain-containing protein [Caulobacter segnis]
MTEATPIAHEKLRALSESTAATSNASTVSAIATTGHVASGGILAAGAYSAASSGGLTALKCFGGRVIAPLGGAMAGAWIAEQVHADEAAFWVAQQFGAQRIAGPGKQAAHLTHQIAHSNAFAGLLAGIAAGIVVGALVAVSAAAIIGTAGMAAPLVGAAVAFGAGAAGGFVTAAIAGAGAKTATLSGPIASGSLNVFFEGKPAARVTDIAACTKHPSVPSLIIEGSKTIFINGLPMARIGHKLSCDAVVQQGCNTVLGDDTTGSYGTPDAELSIAEQLLLSVAEVVGMRSAVRQGGLLDGSLRRLFGEPVDIVTGDYADQRTDFQYPGVLPLKLARTYPGRMRVEGMLGPRWICNWSQRVLLDHKAGTALLEDADGQRLLFAIGAALQIDARHLKAPYYRLTGTRDRLRLFDSRTQQFLLFAPGGDAAVLELAGIEDRNGNRILFSRDAKGRLTQIQHADGTMFRVETTPQGWLSALWMESEREPLVRYGYDADGRLLHVLGAFTGEFHYRYTSEGWLNGWRDSGLTEVEIAYDTAGRVVGTHTGEGMFNDRFLYFPEERRSRYVDATGAVSTFHYDANGLVVEEEDPLGARTISEWDSLERLQRRIDPAGRETRFSYDGDGRLIGETDWAGRSARWAYDGWGALVGFEDPDGAASWTRDTRGNIVAWKEADGASGSAEYDERGVLIREQVAGLGATHWENDPAGRPIARHDPGDRISRYAWDRMGRLLELTDPAGRTSHWAYQRSPENPRGAVSHAHTPDAGEIRFTYDGEGLIKARIRSDGQTTRFVHGAFDTLRQIIDPLGATTQFAYDGAGRLAAITDAVGQQWRFRYDPAGRLSAQVDWAGRETLYHRDILGRVQSKRMPDGAEQRFEWDAQDRIVRVIAGEDAISYRYDDQDRLVGASTWVLVDDAPRRIADVSLAYDGKGRLVREEQNGIAVTYRYDEAGRCVGRSSPSGETAMAFDEAGLLTRYESNGHTLRFAHDASGLETLRELAAIGAPTAFQLCQRYDLGGRLAEQRAGGVTVFAAGRKEPDTLARRYAWDHVGRLAGVDETGAGAGAEGVARYHYDPRDQAVAVERAGGRETYRYDALMNLAEGLAGEHRYWRDCVVEAGPNRFRYDARGRMTERVLTQDGFRPRRWRYRWDGFDRLVGLETPDGARWRYTYDAFGRRVGKTLLDEPNRRVDYVWQGQAIAEAWHRRGPGGGAGGVSGSGSLHIERWHFEPDGVRPLAKELVPAGGDGVPACGEAKLLPIVADQIGAPRALFDAEGECRWRAEAELWGRTRTAREVLRERHGEPGDEPDKASCALRFPGQWEDAESGLHYNLNRYYDSETGQYLSPDPIGLSGGLRTHAYVRDPLKWMDPSGLASCDGPTAYGTPYRQLSQKARSALLEKVQSRTITRAEWQRLQWHDRLTARRQEGIDQFWHQERQNLANGLPGTRNWNAQARQSIMDGGTPRGIFGHHKYSVSRYPQLANDPANIAPVTFSEHFQGWHGGNWRNPSHGVPLKPEFLLDF